MKRKRKIIEYIISTFRDPFGGQSILKPFMVGWMDFFFIFITSYNLYAEQDISHQNFQEIVKKNWVEKEAKEKKRKIVNYCHRNNLDSCFGKLNFITICDLKRTQNLFFYSQSRNHKVNLNGKRIWQQDMIKQVKFLYRHRV